MKFTLRDIFWMVALAAVACGWYIDHCAQQRKYTAGSLFWHRSTSTILKSYSQVRAENEALKASVPSGAAQP